MSANTKIVVLHMKEIIYTGIFLLLGILLVIILLFMFRDKQKTEINTAQTSSDAVQYTAGIYTTSLTLNGNAIDIEVAVDDNAINSIRLVNLDEAVTTMYPLVEPAFDELVAQIYHTQSLEGITYSDESKYTSMVLLDAINTALDKARINNNAGNASEPEPAFH